MNNDFSNYRDEIYETIDEILKTSIYKFDYDKINQFNQVIDEVYKVMDYKDQIATFRKEAEKNIVRYEYAKGGESIHRGYYCPSPILDLVVGNCNRGRLLKSLPKNRNYTYEYAFNSNNEMVRVSRIYSSSPNCDLHEEEYFIRKNNEIFSLIFDRDGQLECITRCIYEDGLLRRYDFSLGLFHPSIVKISKQDYCTEITSEIYTYNEKVLSNVKMYRYSPSIKIISTYDYNVLRDNEGFIVNIIGGETKDGITGKNDHLVKIKRK